MRRAIYYIAVFVLFFGLPLLAMGGGSSVDMVQQALLGLSISDVPPVEEAPAADEPTGGAAACGPAPMRLVKDCEDGGGFLCIDTPPGGTTAETMPITGRIDQREDAFAGLKVVVQHRQTKVFTEIATAGVVDAQGRLQLSVPLSQLGSYAITVQALRIGDAPSVETVYVSRVIAPKAAQATVVVTPAPDTDGQVRAEAVTIAVDLLSHCEQCDLIGSGTGATTVYVENTITGDGDLTRAVSRFTNLGADGLYQLCVPVMAGTNRLALRACNAATGEGFCVELPPVTLDVVSSQPRIHMMSPDLTGPLAFAADTSTTIDLRFRVEGLESTTDACKAVMVEWNRQPAEAVCPNAEGIYALALVPTVGINLGRVVVTQGHARVEQPITVGWGALQSPWRALGVTKRPDELWYPDTVTLGVRKGFVTNSMRTVLNNLLASDRFDTLLQDLVDAPVTGASNPSSGSGGESDPASTASVRGEAPSGFAGGGGRREPPIIAKAMQRIRNEIPYCRVESGASAMRLQLAEPPQRTSIEITRIAFAEDEMQLKIVARDLEGRFQYFKDANHDGTPDDAYVPIHVAFRKLVAEPKMQLVRGEVPLVLLTADTTNCDYQSDRYCVDRPAILMPRNFVGSATPYGSFVACDHVGQAIPEGDIEGCQGLNTLNAQTGMLNEQVLDSANELLYCNGSTALTYLFREAARDMSIHVGCGPSVQDEDETVSLALSSCDEDGAQGVFADRSWEIPLGLNLVHSQFQINTRGMSARMATRVGEPNFFRRLPAEIQQPTFGYFTDLKPPHLPSDLGLSGARDVSLSVSEAQINQSLFILAVQSQRPADRVETAYSPYEGGLLDWDIDDLLLKKLGFDAVKACDEFQASAGVDSPPSLCNLRPRIADFLGTGLTTQGYFSPKHPVMLRLRGSRRLAPRVRFYVGEVPLPLRDDGTSAGTRAAQLIDMQIPDLEIGFYALRIDESREPDRYGNPPLLLDEAGRSIIQSMRPDADDPLEGPIMRLKVTLLLTMEMDPVRPDPNDPTKMLLAIKTVPSLTRIGFAVEPGGNSTLVPDAGLFAALQEKLNWGITIYSTDRDAIRLQLPKRIDLRQGAMASLASFFGVTEFRVAKEGLLIGVDPGQDFLTFGGNFVFTQQMKIDGTIHEWNVPEE